MIPVVGRCWEVEGFKVGVLDMGDEVAADVSDRMLPMAQGEGFK